MKLMEKNDILWRCMYSTIPYSAFRWGPKKQISIFEETRRLLHKSFQSLIDDQVFRKWVSNDVTYSVIDVTKADVVTSLAPKALKNLSDSLKGSSFNVNSQLEEFNKKSLSLPSDIDYGIIILPFGDFIVLSHSSISACDAVELSTDETQEIKKLPVAGRSGSAGGVVFSNTNSHSLSGRAGKDSIFVPQIKGTGVGCVYKNSNDTQRVFKSVYNDIFMSRYNVVKKIKYASKHSAYRRILIEEMKSRLGTTIVLKHNQLVDDVELTKTFLFTESKYEDTIKRYNNNKLKCSFSIWEIMLLEESLSTGEMRNHQAIAAHVDGNKSHSM